MAPTRRHLAFLFVVAGLIAPGSGFISGDQDPFGGSPVGREVEVRMVTPELPRSEPLKAGTGSIFGQITDARSGRPIAGVLVTLRVSDTNVHVMADGLGRFVFRDLPAGSFSLRASKRGFADGANGRLRPRGLPHRIDLSDGEHASANLTLWKFAAVTGRVVDEAGDAMVDRVVRVFRRSNTVGPSDPSMGAEDRTDDRGVYRIGTLEPGQYIVSVPMSPQAGLTMPSVMFAHDGSALSSSAPLVAMATSDAGVFRQAADGEAGRTVEGRPLSYPTTYFPSVPAPGRATVISLASGDERSGIDFRLQPSPTFRVSGVLTSQNGPAANMTVTLVPDDAGEFMAATDMLVTRTTGTGAFTFPAVPRGEHVVRSSGSPRPGSAQGASFAPMTSGNGPVSVESSVVMVTGEAVGTSGAVIPVSRENLFWAEARLAVDTADVTDLALVLRSGVRLGGVIEWTGGRQRPVGQAIMRARVTLHPLRNMAVAVAQVTQEGSFRTGGVVPGRYVVRAEAASPDWFFQGAYLAGQDITDTPLDLGSRDLDGVTVVFTDRQTEAGGTVTDGSGRPDSTTAVVAFPVERQTWTWNEHLQRRFRLVRTGPDGTFAMSGLPPGRYYLAAMPEAEAADWRNPSILDALAGRATTITLIEGQKAVQSLRVTER